MNYILYNQKSHNGTDVDSIKKLEKQYGGDEYKTFSVIGLNVPLFLKQLKKNDVVTLIGGDGTLGHFVNDIEGCKLPCDFYYCAKGTGNDFKNDAKEHILEDGRFYLNDFIKDLPYAIIKGKKYTFINDIGFGIDGYCCEEGDRLQRLNPTKPVNYTSIAIKGLLFKYKRPNAKVTVDGVTREYKKVYLAPTMKGRFYGGGMMVAPTQDRSNKDRTCTCVVMHGVGKLTALMRFTSLFSGTHGKYKDMVDFREGHDFKVVFDKPTALQVDGETISGVLEYEVHCR